MAWKSSNNSQWESSPEPRPLFQEVLRCFPIKRYKNSHLETGDKIILPPSSFSLILYNRIQYPQVFKLQSYKTNAISYSGVMEFDAEEGNVYLPEWTMQNLNIQEGESIVVSNASNVSKGHYMKLRPHKTAFTELADPRVVLEKVLREFTCLGRGSTIVIKYNHVDFYFDVLEVSPGDVITLIDTDCEVEFAPSLEYYVEPRSDGCRSIEKVGRVEDKEREEGKGFRPFTGEGRRLGGKTTVAVVAKLLSEIAMEEEKKRSGKEGVKKEFKPFTGKSCVLGGLLF
ncbi:hypothetical protein ABFS82_05G136400 [Erythranthe guttata]|uniref:ubiquitin fusion degradation protein 1 homolog n=1 Tax=Erythranthe guttata TaxID=4155 RepID=UPI00064DE3CB|nr:PREDICTED: ubiquitin fusion degradation protein 1 homolog [Erythranthe guttata]|eukprot:XP_012847045.1 PREDICTED: ubiquitin fusion degradation protein 1 homolog [Erythranthe guttata]